MDQITINDIITLKNYVLNKYKSKIKLLHHTSFEYKMLNINIKKIESVNTLNFYSIIKGI